MQDFTNEPRPMFLCGTCALLDSRENVSCYSYWVNMVQWRDTDQ